MSGRFYSKYIDIPNEPLYPFGYGLSYTEFQISGVRISGNRLEYGKNLTASVTVKNIGSRAGENTIQLYIRDDSASVVRPVKELKGFRKIRLEPGTETEVCFEITEEMLRFFRADHIVGSEKGSFTVWIDDTSRTENAAQFYLV